MNSPRKRSSWLRGRRFTRRQIVIGWLFYAERKAKFGGRRLSWLLYWLSLSLLGLHFSIDVTGEMWPLLLMKLVQCRWPALTSPLGEIAHPPGQPSRPVSGMGQLDLGVEPPPVNHHPIINPWPEAFQELPCATCRVSGVRICKQHHSHFVCMCGLARLCPFYYQNNRMLMRSR